MNLSRPVRSYFSDFGAVFVLIAFIFWFARGMIWDGQLPFFRDLNTYFYPLRFSLGEAFRAGELPLWDRHFAMGFPMLASRLVQTFTRDGVVFYGDDAGFCCR